MVLPYKGTGVTSLPLRREETGRSVQMPVFQKYTVSKYFPRSQVHISMNFSSHWAFSARGRLLTLEISLPLFISCLTKCCLFLGVLASWDCCDKFPQIWWFEATKTYSLSSRGQRSEFKVATWIGRVTLLPEVLGDRPFLPFPRLLVLGQSLACSHIAPLPASPSPGLLLLFLLLGMSRLRTLVTGFGVHPEYSRIMFSSQDLWLYLKRPPPPFFFQVR